MSIYAVCQTPDCQQTYEANQLLENHKFTHPIYCNKCNGIIVGYNGKANLSGLSDVRTVVGNYLLNALYEDEKLVSIKLKIQGEVLEWYYGMPIVDFIIGLKQAIRPTRKIELTQHSIDGRIVNNEIYKILMSYGIKISNRNILSLMKKKGG